ncbi:MAG TPA: hypothetical protein VIV40_37590 [Kofleriaceae bacterium]
MLPDELDDNALYAAFTSASLDRAQFHHREHVRVAFVCLQRTADLAAAASEFRRSLRQLTVALGVERIYHETLTWAYLIMIQQRMAAADPAFATSFDLIAAHPDLLDHHGGALAKHYDVAAITASPLARSCFVLP